MTYLSLYGSKAAGATFLSHVLASYLGVQTERSIFMETDAIIDYSFSYAGKSIQTTTLVCPAWHYKHSIPKIMAGTNRMFFFISNVKNWYEAGLSTTDGFLAARTKEHEQIPITLVCNNFVYNNPEVSFYDPEDVIEATRARGLTFTDTLVTQIGSKLSWCDTQTIDCLLQRMSQG